MPVVFDGALVGFGAVEGRGGSALSFGFFVSTLQTFKYKRVISKKKLNRSFKICCSNGSLDFVVQITHLGRTMAFLLKASRSRSSEASMITLSSATSWVNNLQRSKTKMLISHVVFFRTDLQNKKI